MAITLRDTIKSIVRDHLVNKKGKAYKCIEIDKVPNGEEIFGALEIFSNQDTLPNIYIDDQYSLRSVLACRRIT